MSQSDAGAGAEPTGPHRRDPAATTRRLLEAAAAEFVEHGYDKAVLNDIARRAGVSAGALFARWPRKTDMMVAALDHIFERLLPEHRINELGLADASPRDIVILWSTHMLESDNIHDVLIHVFGSARNSDAVQQRLARYLNDQSAQARRLLERGPLDPQLSVTAVVLFCQALAIGLHLVLSGGLDDANVPSKADWQTLVTKMTDVAFPPKRAAEHAG